MTRNKKNWDYLVDYRGQYQNVLGSGQKGGSGIQGAKGQKGAPGAQGLQGIQGVGVKGNKGDVGQKGQPSTNTFTFQGNVANQASLPTTGNAQGDVYQTTDTNDLYVWDGTAFVLLSGSGGAAVVKGQKGEEGQKGQKGDGGLKGEKGGPGVDGTKGAAGDKGQKGSLPLISSLPVLP